MVKKTPEYNTEQERQKEQNFIMILGQDRYNQLKEQHQKTKRMENTKTVSIEGLTPVLLAGAVKKVLMQKPYQFKNFKSFSEGMGDEYLPFVNECKKQVKSTIKREIQEHKRKIKELETKLGEQKKDKK